MPQAPRIRHLMLRVGILTALSATTVGAFTGVAAADSAPPSDGSSSTQTGDGSTTDPGQSTGSSDQSTDTTDQSSDTTHTVTFSTPRAVTNSHSAHMRSARARHAIQVHAVLREVQHQRGKPYSYGAAGPRAFDCSGLVMYVFGKAVGRQLPHNAAAQYGSVQHIKKRDLQVGDLVFQDSGGSIFHVGIYAGHGKWWDAPHTGAVVHKHRIYRGHKVYGRVLTYGYATHHRHHHRH